MAVPQPGLRALFDPDTREQIVAVTHAAARSPAYEDLPDDLHPDLRARLDALGIDRLYAHQRRSHDLLVQDRRHTVVATGTASGKTLCFALPALQAAATDAMARSLFLYPTKALAQDQARALGRLAGKAHWPAVYDGDTPADQRRIVRRRATIVLTNPDMLHLGILPAHESWAEFLRHLRYVVLDEGHVYRGIFGSHVADLVRRLRRLCAYYGSDPRFVVSSATMADPLSFAERLTGLPCSLVDADGAPHPERTTVLWNPPLEDPVAGRRRSALGDAVGLLREALLAEARVIAFAPTRRAAELLFNDVRRALAEHPDGSVRRRATRVSPYRTGYTPQQRREIERRLFDHQLDAVIATSALELGIDVGSLDLSVVIGFPGTMTSLLQRWGRAGRSGHGWAVLVAGQDALDQFFMSEPDRLLDRPLERAVIDPGNLHVLRAHLEAAAYELPLTEDDERYFGPEGLQQAHALTAGGRLRRSAAGLAWALPHAPAAETSLRTATGDRLAIVDGRTGAILGELDLGRAFRTAHPGAVYLHLGESYIVRRLDLDDGVVLVEPFRGGYYTQPKVEKNVFVSGSTTTRELTRESRLTLGQIEVTEQVIAFRRRDFTDRRVLDTVPLDLPEQTFATEAFWLTLAEPLVERVAGDPMGREETTSGGAAASSDDERPTPATRIAGTLHATEHVLIAVLPIHAMCDRWDIGGLSTPWHWQTDRATIFVYDAYAGGIGLSRAAYDAFGGLVEDALHLVSRCPCEGGCPSCIQSPKCGNLNEPLDKAGALALLRTLATGAPDPGPPGKGGTA